MLLRFIGFLILFMLFNVVFAGSDLMVPEDSTSTKNIVLARVSEDLSKRTKPSGRSQKSQKRYHSKLGQKVKSSSYPLNRFLQFDIPVIYNKKVQKWVKYFSDERKAQFEKMAFEIFSL